MAIITSIFETVAPVLALAVFLGMLYVIGQTGTLVRRGVEMRRALRYSGADARHLRSKATRFVLLPLLGWVAVYTLLFFLLPLKGFLVSLVLIVGPILVYHGLYLRPSALSLRCGAMARQITNR